MLNFENNSIRVYNNFELDNVTIETLGLPAEYTIAAGEYHIVYEDEDFIFIEF
jgi:hypothetical protein